MPGNNQIQLPLKNAFVAALLPFFLRLLTTPLGIGAGGASAESFDGEYFLPKCSRKLRTSSPLPNSGGVWRFWRQKEIKPPFKKDTGAFLSALAEEDGAQPVVIDQPDAIQT